MASSFEWTRAVPPAWADDLAMLSPGENVSSLHLSWLAGWPYEPVQRWVVYEVLPVSQVGKIIEQEHRLNLHDTMIQNLWNAVKGPDPRTVGKWIPAKVAGGKRWVSNSLVSRNQWDLHKQTGGLPFLSWIIEGDQGGHAWQFGPFEMGFLIAAGVEPPVAQELAEAWPNPGDQPYAPYDARVFRALAERDLLRKWRESLAWEDRANRTEAGLVLQGEAAHRREDMMRRVMTWLDNQIGEAVSDIPRTLLPSWSEFQTTETAPDHEAAVRQVLDN